MKKIHVLGAALLALFAFGVMTASASAQPTFLLALWLEDGAPVEVLTDVEATSSELELVNHDGASFGVTVRVLCSGVLHGSVGPESEDEITELLSLGGTAISKTPLSGNTLSCTNDENCPEPKVWADLESPWDTEAELMEDGGETFYVDLLIDGAYYVECNIPILGHVSELCLAPTTAIELTNEANGTVDALFSDTFQELAGLELGECNGNAKVAEVNGLGFISLNNEKALSVSSE